MKKFAITAFAVFYAILIVSVSAERTNDWAAREAAAFAHDSGSTSVIDQGETHLSQKKIVEPEFVVELPREAVAVQLASDPHVPAVSPVSQATWGRQSSSSRAPPFLI